MAMQFQHGFTGEGMGRWKIQDQALIDGAPACVAKQLQASVPRRR
jgi:hypothetical protein